MENQKNEKELIHDQVEAALSKQEDQDFYTFHITKGVYIKTNASKELNDTEIEVSIPVDHIKVPPNGASGGTGVPLGRFLGQVIKEKDFELECTFVSARFIGADSSGKTCRFNIRLMVPGAQVPVNGHGKLL